MTAQDQGFRKAVLRAYTLPVGLFFVIPYLLFSLPSLFSGASPALEHFLPLLTVIFAIGVVGYVLAPWAGSRIPKSKIPAFSMGAACAVAAGLALSSLSMLQGSLDLALGVLAMFCFFAVPASVLGSLLFIGACERNSLPVEHARPSGM